MDNWTVGITGNEADLAELAKSLKQSGLRISKQFGSYALESDSFQPTDSEEAIRAKAAELLESITGAARLAFSVLSPISVSWVGRRKEDGVFHVSMKFEEKISFRDTVSFFSITRADGSVQQHNPADPVPGFVAQAVKHAVVREVLKLLAKSDNDWVNLYRIFEVIAKDSGGLNAMAASGWASKAKLRNFKHTANSPGALGHDARHGVDAGEPPAAAMPLEEAKALVHDLVKKWAQTKG